MVKSYLKIFIILLIIDFLFSSIFLKNTIYWKNQNWEKKYWRISSEIYHHDLMPNVDVVEKWGDLLEYRITTNSIGFRDKYNKKIKKSSKKKRILLLGDSFIEGSGLNYENTFSGLLQSYLGKDYEVLNSAVASYSPSIYYAKANHFLSQGYEFDQALVFLDISDIYDELFVSLDPNGNLISDKKNKSLRTNKNFIKQKIYRFGKILRDNSITFRLLYLTSDNTEILKNYLKLKYKTSKELKKSFFKTNKVDVLFYRMTHIDRGFWTYDEKTYEHILKGLKQSELKLKKLFELLKNHSIKSSLIIYPWPTQIYFGDNKHEPHWKNFSKKNNIDFVNLYEVFNSDDSKNFILKNFILGDIHWNKSGTKLVFDKIVNTLKF